jgi:hypothetical protein
MPRGLRDSPPALISGPVSAHVFDIDGTRLFIFGDEHFAYDNLCQPCDSRNDCKDIVRFIRGLVDDTKASADTLDVFMELPYVVRDGPGRRRWLRFLDAVMGPDGRDPKDVFPLKSRALEASPKGEGRGARWPFWGGGSRVSRVSKVSKVSEASRRSEARGVTSAMVARVLGNSPKYIGVFSQLYREFRNDLYGENDKSQQQRVRFHYCDARHEVHVQRLLPYIDPVRFHRYVRTSDQLREVLRAFLFARDFPAEARRIFGTREAARVLTWDAAASSSGLMHKVAKQFHALPGGALKDAAKRYLDDRIDDAVSVARLDLNFDDGPHILAAAAEAASGGTGPKSEDLAWLWRFRVMHGQYYAAFFPEVMRFATHLLIMDAYLLCRMLRFSFASPKAGERRTAVVYAGDAHAEYYVSFFKDYLGVKPSVCAKLGPEAGRPSRATDRCVRMASRPATCETLGPRPAAVRPVTARTRTAAP